MDGYVFSNLIIDTFIAIGFGFQYVIICQNIPGVSIKLSVTYII